MEKKLYRDEYRKKLGGVCAGLAEHWNSDVSLIRVLFVIAAILLHGVGLVAYIVLWIVLPKRPYPFVDPMVDYTMPPQNPGGQFGTPPFPNQPFANQPFPNQPIQPPKQSNSSLGAIIAGSVLIVVGGLILLDNIDFIPDWNFGRLWPIIPITVGIILMLSGDSKKKVPADWQTAQEVKPGDNEVTPEENKDNKADAAAADDAEPKA